jgi:hypothetical protein
MRKQGSGRRPGAPPVARNERERRHTIIVTGVE